MQMTRLDLLPLRQRVIPSGDAAPVFARRGLLDWLSRPEKFQITSHGTGGEILAVGESALAEAQAVLRQAYGGQVAFGEPCVHSYQDDRTGATMVPLMFLRIDAHRSFSPWLLQELRRRAAEVQNVERQRDRTVVRAVVNLARLLGFEQQVLETTGGAAQVLSWLLRYAPEPGEAASFSSPAFAAAHGVGAS